MYWQHKKEELDNGLYDDDEDEDIEREKIEQEYENAMQKVKEKAKLPSHEESALTTQQVINKFEDYVVKKEALKFATAQSILLQRKQLQQSEMEKINLDLFSHANNTLE